MNMFARNNTKERKTFDRLVKIDSYNTKDHTMNVTDEGNGDKYTVSINSSSLARNKRFESMKGVKYFGHLIDERMEKSIPVGTRVVLESARELSNMSRECNKIIRCPDDSPEKLYSGIFTATAKKEDGTLGRIASVQEWSNTAIAFSDKPAVVEFAKKLKQERASGVKYPVSNGFMFRTIKSNGDGTYRCLNSSAAMDFEKNGDTYSTISPEFLAKAMKDYAEYVKDLDLGDVVMEIMTYTNFVGSGWSKALSMNSEFSPNKTLTDKYTKGSPDSEELILGKNWGVSGIVSMVPDVYDRGQLVERRSIVNNLFSGGWQGDIRSMIRSHDELKVIVDEKLKIDLSTVEKNPTGSTEQVVEIKQQQPQQPNNPFIKKDVISWDDVDDSFMFDN